MVDENMKKYNEDDANEVNDANSKQHIFIKVVIM